MQYARDPYQRIAVAVVAWAAREAMKGNIEARYWLGCPDVQDTWLLMAGQSPRHVQEWLEAGCPNPKKRVTKKEKHRRTRRNYRRRVGFDFD
jgi:hypothetical protein